MQVMKFGGTSVGSPERMKNVAKLITESGEPTFVVLSAMSGTTNSLVEISDYLYKKNPEGANEVINNLEKKYNAHIEELYSTEEYKQKTREFLQGEFNFLRSFTKDLFTSFEEKSIVAQGEIISTNMVVNYLQECGVKYLSPHACRHTYATQLVNQNVNLRVIQTALGHSSTTVTERYTHPDITAQIEAANKLPY